MEDMVVGFLFSEDKSHVALIRKLRPEWQRMKLNGIGGHIEKDETPEQAMRREFREEAGVDIPENEWKYDAVLTGKNSNWRVHFFHAFGDLSKLSSQTDEEITTTESYFLVDPYLIGNIKWLIPMCLDESIQKPVHIMEN